MVRHVTEFTANSSIWADSTSFDPATVSLPPAVSIAILA